MTTEDGALLSRAFADLPKRWRSVLWLLEVEGLATHEVACAMGLSPNNVAQIAVRGRARLRERYLQAHVGANPAPACEFTTRRLGAHLNTTLSRRDVTKADQHLQVCTVCARRRENLHGLGLKMRTLLPVPLAVIPILRDRSRGRTGSRAWAHVGGGGRFGHHRSGHGPGRGHRRRGGGSVPCRHRRPDGRSGRVSRPSGRQRRGPDD